MATIPENTTDNLAIMKIKIKTELMLSVVWVINIIVNLILLLLMILVVTNQSLSFLPSLYPPKENT